MAYQTIEGVRVWGDPIENALSQAVTCGKVGNVKQVLLMADHHKGYSQPVGGVVVYKDQVSPSGVGYDIACGNKAVRTNIKIDELPTSWMPEIMDAIAREISFGVGRVNENPVDHELFDDPAWEVYADLLDIPEYYRIRDLARSQLGTVGSGNHFVDIFVEMGTNDIWIANHFGSRGFGHKTASGFLNLVAGRKFLDKAPGESMDADPTLLDVNSELGAMYMEAIRLAGLYAYAGRNYVIDQVLRIIDAESTFEVHNHHNFAWKETHDGEDFIVVRKGATPSAPDQLGFIGGSMGDYSVIVRGRSSQENEDAFYSTVHGAGRVMSRTQAAGKMNWKTRERSGGQITPEMMYGAINNFGVELRGAGTDESPFCYKNLNNVIDAHKDTVEVLHTLKPIGVCMAGSNEFDPYKD